MAGEEGGRAGGGPELFFAGDVAGRAGVALIFALGRGFLDFDGLDEASGTSSSSSSALEGGECVSVDQHNSRRCVYYKLLR